ncbi:Tannase/feruloyl esterase [Plectosphaerella plurivora]|uniref:Carboxylic ester hydrolase n=1 Tax=Plectosphaerella plurivora TaxID=936078 RepID=A0A9P9A975_9PEZI|nr:Tannase/feruloyl esterase [Plectosphaerella plurivora]
MPRPAQAPLTPNMASIQCTNSFFNPPVLPGIEVISLSAEPVSNYTLGTTIPVANHGAFTIQGENFCKVIVTYSRPGAEDGGETNIQVWLPSTDRWNERIMAVGGGGWSPGGDETAFIHMAGAVSLGYASFTTDGGIGNPWVPADWALKSPGETNYDNVENWGTRSLVDMASAGKDIVGQFYEKPPAFSYYSGCSQGGRQGYELAQKYPEAFDGIAAAAPGISLPKVLMSLVWPQLLLNLRGQWPRGCELDSVDAIALALCDSKDGIADGIVSDPTACDPFDPLAHVGEPAALCPDGGVISETAAYIVNATWTGMVDEAGESIFPGQHVGTDLSNGVLLTTCDEAGTCTGVPAFLGTEWIDVFGYKIPAGNFSALTLEEFYTVLRRSSEEFAPYIGSSNPDLGAFKARGGKLLTIHGLIDQLLPAGLLRQYYDDVTALDPAAKDFYRLFQVPGLGHCIGNGNPVTAFDALRAWVENGTAPAALPVTYALDDGSTSDRIVCPYPQKVRYSAECGDPAAAECFSCSCQV